MGKLIDWYRQAAIGIVGGTFGNAGGHSPLEPVQAGIPIFFGPSQHSAESLFHDIQRVGAGSEVAGGVPLWRAIEGLLSDRTRYEAAVLQGRSLISQKKGASQRTLQALENIWPTRLGNSAPAVVRRTQASGVVWLDPEIASMQEFRDAAAFSWLRNPFFARPLSAGGRGRAFFVDINGRRGLFRHYRRGGLLGRVIDDTYIGSQPDGSRAMREFSLLRWAKLSGLPVPRPLAANIEKHGLLRYKANLITEEIVDAEPLSTCLTRHPLGPDLWKRVGVLLTRLHSHQIYHADLNCHNLLIDRQETIWIIDFDKSYVLPGNTWKAKNLARLYRSLKKEASRSEHFYFCDDDWVVLFLAYHARPNTL
jgi:3-deoxy-D-manno-octulosonic-acid transferase